jgi:hypothetical protein
MLVMDVHGLAGTDRAYARFWNHLHSIESALAGVKLGLWLRAPESVPAASPGGGVGEGVGGGVIVAFGWPIGADQFQYTRVAMGVDALHAFDWNTVQAVALARFELPEWTHDLLRKRMDYSATIPGQVSGWWADQPQGLAARPNGALLPEAGMLADQRECLVLVDVDDWWGVLSALGLGSYPSGAQLEAGETVSFFDEHGRRWAARRIEDATPGEVRARWGVQAAVRTRAGAPAVRVRVSSIH